MPDASTQPIQVDPASQQTIAQVQQLDATAKSLSDVLQVTSPNSKDAKGQPTFDSSKFVSDAYGALQKAATQVQGQLNQNQTSFQQATQQDQAAVEAKATADQQAGAVQAAAQIKQKADALSSAAMFGVTPGAPDSTISDAAAQIKSDLAEYTARDKDMQQRRTLGFLDDPVQWMVNRVVLGAEGQLQTQTEASMNAQQTAILRAQGTTQSSIQIATATDAVDATKQLAAVNAGIKAKADEAVAESQMKLAQFGQQTLGIRDAVNQQQFSSALSTADFDVKKQELYLQEGYKQIQEQMLGLRIGEKATTDQDKAALDAGLKNLGNFINIPGLNIQSLKMRPNDQREALDRMLGYGAMTEGGVLGSSAGQVFTDLNITNAQGGNAGMNYVRGKVSDLLTTAMAAPMMMQKLGNKQLGQLPAAAQADITNQVVNEGVRREFQNRPTEGGIYSPGPWKTTLPLINAAAPALAAALGPQIAANPLAASDPQAVVNTQLQRIKAGQLNPAQAAAEVARSYQAINADIVQQRNLKQLAMRLPSSYNAAIASGSTIMGFGAKRTVDLASQAALQSFFTRSIIDSDEKAGANARFGLTGGKQ